MPAPQEKPAHAGPAALPRAARHLRKETPRLLVRPSSRRTASPQGSAAPSRPFPGCLSLRRPASSQGRAASFPGRLSSLHPTSSQGNAGPSRPSLLPSARLPRNGTLRRHVFPCAARLHRKGTLRRHSRPRFAWLPSQGSAAPLRPFPGRPAQAQQAPRRSRAAGPVAFAACLACFPDGAVALGLCPALAVLLPSLGEELIQ